MVAQTRLGPASAVQLIPPAAYTPLCTLEKAALTDSRLWPASLLPDEESRRIVLYHLHLLSGVDSLSAAIDAAGHNTPAVQGLRRAFAYSVLNKYRRERDRKD